MLSGQKKKYSPYLDTGLMDEAAKRAESMGLSLNEYISLALVSFVEQTPAASQAVSKHWAEKILASEAIKEALEKELANLISSR